MSKVFFVFILGLNKTIFLFIVFIIYALGAVKTEVFKSTLLTFVAQAPPQTFSGCTYPSNAFSQLQSLNGDITSHCVVKF